VDFNSIYGFVYKLKKNQNVKNLKSLSTEPTAPVSPDLSSDPDPFAFE
jgi:hypothetical protein